jgi:hypothetical protein
MRTNNELAMRHLSYPAGRPTDEAPSAFSSAGDSIRPGRLSRPPALPAHLAALRDRLRPAKSPGGCLPFNDPRVDACLPSGGLPLGQLHEVGAAGLDAETAALPTAFIAALLARIASEKPVFWIAPSADLHPPGWGRWDSSAEPPRVGCSLPAWVMARPASHCAAGRTGTGPPTGRPALPSPAGISPLCPVFGMARNQACHAGTWR